MWINDMATASDASAARRIEAMPSWLVSAKMRVPWMGGGASNDVLGKAKKAFVDGHGQARVAVTVAGHRVGPGLNQGGGQIGVTLLDGEHQRREPIIIGGFKK